MSRSWNSDGRIEDNHQGASNSSQSSSSIELEFEKKKSTQIFENSSRGKFQKIPEFQKDSLAHFKLAADPIRVEGAMEVFICTYERNSILPPLTSIKFSIDKCVQFQIKIY